MVGVIRMLGKIIEKQCENFGVNREKIYKNERVSSLGIQSTNLAKKVTDLDKNLGDEIDVLIGNMIATYGDVYFQEGFKQGLILAQEIQHLLLKNS